MKMKQKPQIAALRGRGDSYKKIGLIEDCGLAQSVLCDTLGIDVELAEMNRELEMVSELSRKAIYENARTAMSQSEWSERNNSYLERHRQASHRLEELEAQKRDRLRRSRVVAKD